MEKNIGKADKRIRLLAGAVIIITGAYLNSVWGILGMIPVITVQIGVCPLYSLLHLSTISKTSKKQL